MHGLSIFLISTSTITSLSVAVSWFQKRKKEAATIAEERELCESVLSSPDSSWRKVGTVKELILYPLKSGKGKLVKECNLDEQGVSVDEPGVFSLKDRMFILYNEETRKYTLASDYSKLHLVEIVAIDDTHAKLEVAGMPSLVFQLPNKDDKNTKIIECFVWLNDRVYGFDCGPDVSKWFSNYLINADSGISLGMYIPEKSKRNFTNGIFKDFAEHYKAMRDEDAGLFSYMASYMVISQSSVDVLNKKIENPIPAVQLRPNIVVEGCEAYAEDDWEWIKIGNNAVIRNFKPCTRCAMTRIDPRTGLADPKAEVLKVLRSYRKLKDPELHTLEGYSPAIGVYCGLYRTGLVKLNDVVYVYQP